MKPVRDKTKSALRPSVGRDKGKNEPVWSVWRKDDNGNVFLVESGLTEADALRLVREYERKGHKQTYWARENSRISDNPDH